MNSNKLRDWQAFCYLVICLMIPVNDLMAMPYKPDSDDIILERLPLSASSATRELRELRNKVSANPAQIELATNLAERYIAIGKSEADPRYYGYAQGVLKPWWNLAEPPPEVLMLRASILQNRHDFDNALQDLDKLLKRDPHNAQAWLAHAVILQVRARYDEAKRSCLKLLEFKDTMPAITCLSNVSSLMGQAPKSYALLSNTLMNSPTLSEEQRLWSLTVLAEMAVRLDKKDEADYFFSEGLKVRNDEVYLLTAYADFLLDQNKPAEVLTLLKNKTNVDALLLRQALAKKMLSASDLSADVAALRARFEASRMRGESLHQGDEARLHLFLFNQPQQALQLARANWQAQREPRDARILLQSALAAKQPDAAKPVLDLLDSSGMEDSQLRKLVAQFLPVK